MATSPKPQVLLLSLCREEFFNNMYAGLLTALHARATVSKVRTPRAALKALSAPDLKAVFVTDAGLTERKHAPVCARVIEYARGGGTVVIGAHFCSFVRMDDLDAHFRAWSLPWKKADYRRETQVLDPAAHPGFRSNASLPASYSMKAVTMRGVAVGDIVYKPSTYERRYADEGSVAHTRVGNGYLGYIGDVNAEEASAAVVLALCGLPL